LFTRHQLPAVRHAFNQPYHLWMTQEFGDLGWNLVLKTLAQKRAHDVTLFIEGIDHRFALMAKHSYPPGLFRSSSGGIQPGEDFIAASLREAREETGLSVQMKKFTLHVTLDITHNKEMATWETYVFHALTRDSGLGSPERKEVREARWATRNQIEKMNERLIATENGGLIYRARLNESFLWALDHDLTFREGNPKDLPLIEAALKLSRMDASIITESFWFIAEIDGLLAGTVALLPREDHIELAGLTTEPFFRGRGVGHALAEHAVDKWNDVDTRNRMMSARGQTLPDELWLLTELPMYFQPVGFMIPDPKEVLPSIKVRQSARHTAMRYISPE
jgi:N-acetylglutamate synthase-like GNAT family acetyltransferase/ADP-ribose pyrophosphatase YjhB (NUDIX family)